MHTISRDSPCYYLTAVANWWSALKTTDGRVFGVGMGSYYLMSHYRWTWIKSPWKRS
jgi:hypothetical protein